MSSLESDGLMNPKPLVSLKNFTVPCIVNVVKKYKKLNCVVRFLAQVMPVNDPVKFIPRRNENKE
jgi:hypothetical protein